MPRKKKLNPCERCGSLMIETETGRYCPTCKLIEWIDEGGIYTSGMEKCPACHNMSPNSIVCTYCSTILDPHMYELFKQQEKQKK